MEDFQGKYSKATTIKVPPGMKTQKLILGSGPYRSSSLSHTGFDSENVDLNAPILRYLCGGSPIAGRLAPRGSRTPLSAVENLVERSPPPAVYRTPVKAVEGEEVLVMDGVPVRRSPRFSGSASSGSSGKSLFKAEIFQSPEDSGNCRYYSKCQFAHGKEDLRPTRLSIKNRTESQVNRSYSNSPGLCTYSPSSLFLPQIVSPTFSEAAMTPNRRASLTKSSTPIRIAPPATVATPTPTAPIATTLTPARTALSATSVTPTRTSSAPTSVNPAQTALPTTAPRNTTRTLTTAITWTDWSPQDDGIEVTLPCLSPGKPSSRESVNAYIDTVLSGCSTRRLPVFSKMCLG